MSVVKFMRPTRLQRVQVEKGIESELFELSTVIRMAEQRMSELHQLQDRLIEMDEQDFEKAYGGRRGV